MNKFLISIAAFAVLLTTPPVFSKELVSEFKGSESRVTAEFEVKAPWIIDWRTNGDYPGSMGIQVSLLSSPGDEYLGKVVSTKYVDNGVKLFEEGGRYRLQ